MQRGDTSKIRPDRASQENASEVGELSLRLNAGDRLGKFSTTIILHSPDPEKVATATAGAIKTFGRFGGSLYRETYNALNAYLAAIPGNAQFNKRQIWMLQSSVADASLVYAPDPGDVRNQFLNAEYLFVAETNSHTPHFLNLHVDDVCNFFACGATGAGKSVMANVILDHLQKYSPRTLVLDIGGSYQHTCRKHGGSYASLDLSSSKTWAINPFSLPETDQNREYLEAFLRLLLSSSRYEATYRDDRAIHEAVGEIYGQREGKRQLSNLKLPDHLTEALYIWTGNGPYAHVFDNAEDNITFAKFQVFEMQGLESYPRILEPLFFYIFLRQQMVVQDPALRETMKFLLADEVWRFLTNKTCQEQFVSAAKTYRKHLGGLGLVTQSSFDLTKVGLLDVVSESCPTKIFLANPAADFQAYAETFHLNEAEVDSFKRLIKKQQFLLKKAEEPGIVLNLKLSPHKTWSMERSVQPLIMASQIQGLPDMACYFVEVGHVVKIFIPNIVVDPIAPALVERMIPQSERQPEMEMDIDALMAPSVSGAPEGEPTPKLVSPLAEGRHPGTGEQLIRWRDGAQPEPAWVNDAAAWKEHVESLFVRAMDSGRNPLDPSSPITAETDTAAVTDALRWMMTTIEQTAPSLRKETSAEIHAHLGLQEEKAKGAESPSEHRAAWDMTFGAPKSVSLAGLVGGDDRVLKAHRTAVKEALDYGEEYLQARRGGNRPPITTGKAVFALFEHDTSRPVNGFSAPHLHTHVVLFNLTNDGEKFRSLDPVEMFRLQSALSAVYQSRLAIDLQRAGYAWEHGKNHSIQIKGFSEEYLQAASPRTEQIEKGKQEAGQYGPVANQQINFKTRQAKSGDTPEAIRESHQAQAREFGDQPQHVVGEARMRDSQVYSEEYRREAAHNGLTHARNRLIERAAIFDESEVFRDALRFGRGYTVLADVRKAFSERDTAEFQEVFHWRENAPGRRFTTPEMIQMERDILQFTRDGVNTLHPIANGLTKEQFRLQFGERLNNGQMWLAWNAIHSTDRMIGIQGAAGSGKTTALEPLREFTERYGYEVCGLASTSGAVNKLNTVGVNAQSMQSFLARKQAPHPRPRAYFVDESSLVDTQQLHNFLGKITAADRVFLIGDTRQHSSIGAGRIFAELQQAGMATFRLEKIVRQQNAELRNVVKEFASGSVEKGVSMLKEQDRIQTHAGRQERYEALAESYASSGLTTLVISPDNKGLQQQPCGNLL